MVTPLPLGRMPAQEPDLTPVPAVPSDGLDSASATTFSVPGVWRISVVNSEMYAKCRCWRADQGGDTRTIAETSGLWSVSRRN